jgi:hypothetical protein
MERETQAADFDAHAILGGKGDSTEAGNANSLNGDSRYDAYEGE